MSQFEVLLRDQGGCLHRRLVRASGIEHAKSMMAQEGMQWVSVVVATRVAAPIASSAQPMEPFEHATQAPAAHRIFSMMKGGRGFSALLFAQEIRSLLQAGLTLIESLEALAEKDEASPHFHVLHSLLNELKQGRKFSQALTKYPDLFSPVLIGLLESGEKTSDLDAALHSYIDYQQRVETFRAKLVSASIYPVILMVVGMAVCIFLMAFVVPRFAAVYQGSTSLPAASRWLLEWGDWLNQHSTLACAMALAVVLALGAGWAWMNQQGRWTGLAARIPGLSVQLRQIALTRLYMTLGMLMESGMTVVQAIDLSLSALPPEIRRRLQQARHMITQGRSLSEAFDQNDLLTPVSKRMVRVGERSGQLGKMLSRASVFYDQENSRWLERFTKMIEPVLMTVIGLIVGLIVVLLYQPIFDLAGAI